MSDFSARSEQQSLATRQPARLRRRQCLYAVFGAWRPLVAYQLLASLVITLAVWPWLLSLSYALVEFSGEPALGDMELARFLLTPWGALSLVLFASVFLGLVFVEYSGLIVLADAAIRGRSLSIGQLFETLIRSAPRLFALALVTSCVAVALALPFIGLGAVAYWLLLSGSDFYFYWTERPARFWIAVAVWGALALGFVCCCLLLVVRWAFAVPTCALEGRSWRKSLLRSSQRSRGRGGRLLVMLAGWLVLKYAVLFIVVAASDRINKSWLAGADVEISRAIWSTAALLIGDAIVLQLVASAFAIGTAAILAIEVEQARDDWSVPQLPADDAGIEATSLRAPAWAARAAILLALVAGPLVSLGSGLLIAHEWIDHRHMLVTAHRAGPPPAPENSLAALRLAIDLNVDYVEIDVQQTADGHVVLVHDRDLRRVTGDPRDVADVTLADLRQLRLLEEGRPGEERIPTLAEFLAACGDRLRVNVEMKDYGGGPALGQAVAKVLREEGFLGRAVTSSFQMAPLAAARQTEPELPIGAILSAAKGDVTRLSVNFLSLNQRLVSASLVQRAHRRGLEIHVWGVNDRETTLRMLDLGCDNLITREPALVRNVVAGYAELSDTERMLLRLRRWMRE